MKKGILAAALTLTLFGGVTTFAVPLVHADLAPNGSGSGAQPNGSGSGVAFQLTNPLSTSSFCGLLQKVLNAAIQLGIPVAVVFIVYAGFLFIKARGNPGELEHAKKNMLYVVIGIGLFLGAWTLGLIIQATLNNLQQGSGNPSVSSCS